MVDTDIVEKLQGYAERPLDWLTENEFMDLVGASKNTVVYWRKIGKLSYSKVGVKVWIKISDVIQFLTDHYYPAKEKVPVPEQRKEAKLCTLADATELRTIIGENYIMEQFSLTEREIKCIEMRWKRSRTYDEVAEELGVTRERARQIYQKGIRRWRRRVMDYAVRYKDYLATKDENKKLQEENQILKDKIEKFSPEQLKNVEAHKIFFVDMEDISVRLYNVMSACKIQTLGELIDNYSPNEIVKFRNCGRKTIMELESILEHHGLTWK